MGISSVLAYLQATLDGQPLDGSTRVEVHTIPMPALRNGMPEPLRLYIFPSRVRITQPTMSEAAGYRRAAHQPLAMVLRQTVNQVTSVENFPVLVDGLLEILMKLPANIPIDAQGNVVTNPVAKSWITFIGSGGPGVEFDVQFRYPRMVLDQRPVTLVCEIGAAVQEQVVP